MPVLAQDRSILRELGDRYAQIAHSELNRQKITLWQRHNVLQSERPLVLFDQLPWHELNADCSLDLICEDPFLRQVEQTLRRALFQHRHFPGDAVWLPMIEIPMNIHIPSYGVEVRQDQISLEDTGDVSSHRYYDQLDTIEKLDRLATPTVTVDHALDARQYEIASEIFFGILPVKMTGHVLMLNLWDRLSTWRGVDNLLYDIIDRPDFIHQTIAKLVSMEIEVMRQLEAMSALEINPKLVHCSVALTEQPSKRPWAAGMAQMFSTVSPAMHQEFEIDYVTRFYDLCGPVYYGCCEPLHDRIDLIKKISGLRKVSVSPWANAYTVCEALGRDYICVAKPNPAYVARNFDQGAIESQLRGVISACRANNTPLEFILKDVSTISYRLDNLTRWHELAMRIVME